MDVYLIPVGADRYELYCEHIASSEALDAEAPEGSGRIAAAVHRFKLAIERVEQEQQSGAPPPLAEGSSWVDRLKRRGLCWIAEKVAEWRLLWRLRKESDVTLFFADDLTEEQATAIWRRMLKREADRHLRWTIIDGVLLAASALATIIPGPNALAYYFGFRFFGHLLSHRGATHGLHKVIWHGRPTQELSVLRSAIALVSPERELHVRAVADSLHLQNLATFVARTAIPVA